MSQPYVGEIRIFAGNFAPNGWAFCDGALLPIAQYDALFNLIGTTYGGDGQNTFGLPNLCGRLPLHQGTNPNTGTTYSLGQPGGAEQVTLTVPQIPAHRHLAQASRAATSRNAAGNVWAQGSTRLYSTSPPDSAMANQVGAAGGSQPHANLQPFLSLNFIISLFGIFPSQ